MGQWLRATLIFAIVIVTLSFYMNCSKLGGAFTEVSAEETSAEALSATAETTILYYGESTDLEVSGGKSPYTVSLYYGLGSVDEENLTYTAPNSRSSVSIKVKSSDNQVVYIYISVKNPSDSSISVIPDGSTVFVSEKITFSASGGESPYSYTILSGPGSFNDDEYTSSEVGDVQIRVTDNRGAYADTSLTVVQEENYSATANLITDHYVGVTYNYSNTSVDGDSDLPSLYFWGTGATFSEIGKNVSCGNDGQNLTSPCVVKVDIPSFNKSYTGTHVYKGKFSIQGRNATATAEFCIKPSSNNIMYLYWTQTSFVASQSISYETAGSKVLNGLTLQSTFNAVDMNSGAGNVKVQVFESGYKNTNKCGSQFSSSNSIFTN